MCGLNKRERHPNESQCFMTMSNCSSQKCRLLCHVPPGMPSENYIRLYCLFQLEYINHSRRDPMQRVYREDIQHKSLSDCFSKPLSNKWSCTSGSKIDIDVCQTFQNSKTQDCPSNFNKLPEISSNGRKSANLAPGGVETKQCQKRNFVALEKNHNIVHRCLKYNPIPSHHPYGCKWHETHIIFLLSLSNLETYS